MSRPRLAFKRLPSALYAIGDVHGCLAQLLDLERRITADAAGIEGPKWIVMLGDYVDRGPQSAAVIAHLLGPPPPGFERICLLGNHEEIMLDFLEDPEGNLGWLAEGGLQTLHSYGIDLAPERSWLDWEAPLGDTLRHRIPPTHLAFLRRLPALLHLPGWLFVHAGIRPGMPLDQQLDEDLVWIREPFLSARLPAGLRVVHGHTPGPDPVVTPHRIGIDTHCFASGRLTALRVLPAETPAFLFAHA